MGKLSWRRLAVEYYDGGGWLAYESEVWVRHLLRRFRRYGGLGSLKRVLFARQRVERSSVDFAGLDDTLAVDAVEVARLERENVKLIEKAKLVTADLGDAGRLSPAQAERFFDIISGKVR